MRFTKDDDRLDAIFSALAHPIRRALLVRLANGARTVGELAEPFDVSLMAISKHLRVLERASLVQRESEGRYTRCRIEPEGFVEASAWIENHSRFWASQFASLGDYLKQSTPRSDPGA
jgi:DNA-binding transcriptional ArsR family regulator